jgi:hypothetical protein
MSQMVSEERVKGVTSHQLPPVPEASLSDTYPPEIARLSLGQDSRPQTAQPPDINSKGVVAVDVTQSFSRAVQSE